MLRLNNMQAVCYLIAALLLYGCETRQNHSQKKRNIYCVIDTVIFNNNFSICRDKDSNNAVIEYKNMKQIITWSKDESPSKDTNGIIFFGDLSLKSINSFLGDSTYLFSLNDNDINEGVLYCIKFNSNGKIELCKDLQENYNYLLCRYGQFILDTSQKSILIANQNINEADSTEDFTFSVYSFRENTFKYINTIKGNTHYIYTQEQMLNLLSNYR